MIEVSPAILTADQSEFDRQIATYAEFATQIDIDLNVEGDNFDGRVTVDPIYVLPKLSQFKVRYGIHLMVEEPAPIMSQFLSNSELDLVFYVHQSANYQSAVELSGGDIMKIGIAVKAEETLEKVDFYKRFPEVQFMTIETGKQGNSMQSAILERVNWLKGAGYDGRISIDGGVNLETARTVSQFPLDRASVGSYLSGSSNPKADYYGLMKTLNPKQSTGSSIEKAEENSLKVQPSLPESEVWS